MHDGNQRPECLLVPHVQQQDRGQEPHALHIPHLRMQAWATWTSWKCMSASHPSTAWLDPFLAVSTQPLIPAPSC